MAGIYIHIPFCRQACHYCNFHFSTSLRYKNELLAALLKETELQKDYLGNELVETIYFGGGTPSILQISDLRLQTEKIREIFSVSDDAEITLEANPDDISEEKLAGWKEIGINRLSIGVQSFFEEDLLWMNRAHNAQQAIDNLQLAIKQFDNITIDLIYGHPLLSNEKWKQNVVKVIALNIPHISCYALTVEPKTPLSKMIKEKKREGVQQEKQAEQFLLLMQWLEDAGYEHYEISNFAKPGFRSRHNSSYWQGKNYLGLGPSAHSFNGESRQWNISNNNTYIESLEKITIPFEKETLTPSQKTNEYIMTALRTKEGLDLDKLPGSVSHELRAASNKFIGSGRLILRENKLILTKEGKLFADGIAAELFVDAI
ncbi:MAG TPA: radical SAM family heme chaperone HemW [Chitinophagaceae bacterium]|nr:radical SAM family heme chaperone HemW [Chitinophagaceae bacterium]